MKPMNLLLIAVCLLLLLSCGPTHVVQQSPPVTPPPAPPVVEETSYQAFYDNLSPYGDWVNYSGYGYVFVPHVSADFKPYSTNGHWVYSNEGWVWASDYPWGWATFHYGRWFFENAYGWIWVPGHEWAPAWVSWRRSDEYYGWAPLSPGININVSIGDYNPPQHYWNFVPHQYVTSPNIHNYYINESRNTTIINNTTVINNTTIVNNHNTTINNTMNNNTNINNNTVNHNIYRAGPDAGEVGRASGTTLQPVIVSSSTKPGQATANGQLAIYRPVIKAVNSNNGRAPAPQHVQDIKNLQPRPMPATATVSTATQSSTPIVNNVPKPVEKPLMPENNTIKPQQPAVNPGKPKPVAQTAPNKPATIVPHAKQQQQAPITQAPKSKNTLHPDNNNPPAKNNRLPVAKATPAQHPAISKGIPEQKQPKPGKQQPDKKPTGQQ